MSGADDRLALVAKRIDYLDALADGPRRKPALVDALGDSRSTVDRAVRRLVEAGLVERTDDGFRATLAGRLAADRYRRYRADAAAVLGAASFLAALPPDCDLPLAAVRDGRIDGFDDAGRAVETLLDPLRDADGYAVYLPELRDSRHLRLVHARVRGDGMAADLHCTPTVLDRLRTEFPRLAADLATAEGVTVHRVESDRGYTLAVASGTEPTVALAPTADPTRLLTATADSVLEWADATLAGLRTEATDVTEEIAGLAETLDATPLGRHERRGVAGVADIGFEALDEPTLAARTPNDPATGWRVGFDLADAYRGYPFERRVSDGSADPGDGTENDGDGSDASELVADRLADSLAEGHSRVLVGPPGTGKSTVCRLVACRWLRADRGPVLYRATPNDTPFDRFDPLAAALETEGHALVVVEDASADATAPRLAALLERARDDPTVSVLAESRTDRWPPEAADARAAELFRTELDGYRLGELTLAECRAAVEAFEAATGRTVPVGGETLYETVREGDGPGDCHLLGYLLAAYTSPEPWSDAAGEPTGLDADARAGYELVAPDGPDDDTTALAVGLLAAVLAAAEQPVTTERLHAVAAAADDTTAHRRVDAAIDTLRGVLLFDREDGGFRTQHRYWAVRFLEAALDADERTAVRAFERALSALFAVADDPERRERVASWLGADFRDRLAAAPDALVEATFDTVTHHASLAPLFGTTARSGIALPDAVSDAARLEVRACRLQAWYSAGDPDRAEREAEALLDAVESADVDAATASRAVVRAHKRLADVADDRGDHDAARGHLYAALRAARDAGDVRGEVTVLNTLGMVELHADDYDAAEAHLRAADERGGDLGATPERSATVYYLGRLARRRGDYDAAEAHLRESLAIDRRQEPRDRADEAATLNGLGMVAADRGDFAAAESYYRRALERQRTANNCRGVAAALANLGDAAVETGAYDDAEACFEEAVAIAAEIEAAVIHGAALGGLGRVATARGDYDDAEAYHERRLAVADTERARAVVARRLGDVAVGRGEYDRAREQYARAFERFRDLDAADRAAEVALALVEACEADGDEHAAREWCERARALAEREGLRERAAEAADVADRLAVD